MQVLNTPSEFRNVAVFHMAQPITQQSSKVPLRRK